MIQKFGLTLFLAAFGLFVATLGMNEFRFTSEILVKNVKAEQVQEVQKQLAPMMGKVYSNVFAFTNDLTSGINQLNKSYDAVQAWDKKFYEDNILALTKASASGYLVDNKGIMFFLTFVLAILGGLVFSLSGFQTSAGIKNNGVFFNPAMA